jgi:hypothetical protein
MLPILKTSDFSENLIELKSSGSMKFGDPQRNESSSSSLAEVESPRSIIHISVVYELLSNIFYGLRSL